MVNDGWFSRGAAWSPDESKVAYVAEVRAWPVLLWVGADWLLIYALCHCHPLTPNHHHHHHHHHHDHHPNPPL